MAAIYKKPGKRLYRTNGKRVYGHVSPSCCCGSPPPYPGQCCECNITSSQYPILKMTVTWTPDNSLPGCGSVGTTPSTYVYDIGNLANTCGPCAWGIQQGAWSCGIVNLDINRWGFNYIDFGCYYQTSPGVYTYALRIGSNWFELGYILVAADSISCDPFLVEFNFGPLGQSACGSFYIKIEKP